MDNNTIIKTGNINLEAVINKSQGHGAVIVTHPHPLYGGNMDNPVVVTIADAFIAKGFTSLRFNFRGTGNSTGTFDGTEGEPEDVRAAISFLKKSGYETIWLAGYSFGARINASVMSNTCEIHDHIMISPPVAFMSFDDVPTMPKTGLVVTGANDELAPMDQIKAHIRRWGINPQFEVIESCDHFYSGCLNHLGSILNTYLSE